jgi:hypothetical protein
MRERVDDKGEGRPWWEDGGWKTRREPNMTQFKYSTCLALFGHVTKQQHVFGCVSPLN